MATITELVLQSVLFLGLIQNCSAYCYGYCWYSSWYIWFAVIVTISICCGAIGSYIRRRRLEKALRNRQAEIVTVQVHGQVQGVPPQMADVARPYIYPPGGAAQPYPSEAAMMPPPYQSTANYGQEVKKHPDDQGILPPSYNEAVTQAATPGPAGGAPVPVNTAYMASPPTAPTDTAPPYPTQPQVPGASPYQPEPYMAPYPAQAHPAQPYPTSGPTQP